MELSCVLLHVVFSTKDRRAWISQELRQGMQECLHGTLARSNNMFVRCAVLSDHVHVALYLGKMERVERVVAKLKLESQQWIKVQGTPLERFRWQREFFAFSVGLNDRNKLIAYLDAQEEVHARREFQAEVRAMLTQYEIGFDERFIWQ